MATSEADTILQVESVMTKKAENRPVTPEEYQTMRAFVDRVQLEIIARRDAKRQAEFDRLEAIRELIPSTAYDVVLQEVGLSTRVLNLLGEAGYKSAGQVLEQLELDVDKILGLPGVGPKAIKEMGKVLRGFEYPEPEPEVVAEEEIPIAEEVIEVVDAVGIEPVPEEIGLVETPVGVASEIDLAMVEPVAEVDAEIETTPEGLKLEPTLEEAFQAVADELITVGEVDEESVEEEEIFPGQEEKRKKRKEISRLVEYDPDTGEMVVKRRRKRQAEDWEDSDF